MTEDSTTYNENHINHVLRYLLGQEKSMPEKLDDATIEKLIEICEERVLFYGREDNCLRSGSRSRLWSDL